MKTAPYPFYISDDVFAASGEEGHIEDIRALSVDGEQVAFHAVVFGGGRSGLYTDFTGELTRVVGKSDTIDGKIIPFLTSVRLPVDGFEGGSLLFHTELSDPQSGLFSGGLYLARMVPPAPNLILPAGQETIDERKPHFSWNEVPLATWYYLWIEKEGKIVEQIWLEKSSRLEASRRFPLRGLHLVDTCMGPDGIRALVRARGVQDKMLCA